MATPAVEAAREVGAEIISDRVAAIEKAGGTFPRIARELCSIAFSDIADYVTVAEGGELSAIPLQTISPRKRKAIRKIKENTKITESSDGTRLFKDSRVEYELYDKLDALKYLCRLRGDEVEKVEHSGSLEIKDAHSKLESKLLPELAAGGAEGTAGKPE